MREVVVLKLFRFATLFLAIAVAGGLDAGTNGAAAQSLNQLRASGAVGERYDGFAVVRQNNAAARKVVANANAQRRKIYAQRAKSQGVSPAQVGRVYAKQIMQRAPKGTWFQTERGAWRRK